MTTFAFKDGVLAADTRMTSCGVPSVCSKIFKRGNTVITVSGNLAPGLAFVDWYHKGADMGNAPQSITKEASFYAYVVHLPQKGKKCRVEYWDDDLYPVPIRESMWSGGSGGSLALGAMEAGATAREAVRIAIKNDVNSGGKVEVYNVKTK